MPGNFKKYYFLFPFAVIYWLIVIIRNKLFDIHILPEKEFNIPIISVGNITVGGTGKTPHIEYLIRILKRDFNIATLSRGYKRKTRGFILSTIDSKSTEIGDEPRQLKYKFPNTHIAVSERRVKGIEKLIKQINNLDAVLLDDAYQHRYVKAGINILLIDFNRIITKDYLLPVGRLREPSYEMHRASIIIITKCPQEIKPIEKRIIQKEINPFPFQKLFFTTYSYQNIEPVFVDKSEELGFDYPAIENHCVMLITGIANSGPIKNYISKLAKQIIELKFSDHHNFVKKDIEKIINTFRSINCEQKLILTTEKDAVRLKNTNQFPEEIENQFYYLPIEVKFLFNEQDEFISQILNYVQKNKKHSIISQKQV